MKRCKLCEMAFVVLGWSALMARAFQPASTPSPELKTPPPATAGTPGGVEKKTVASPHPMICEVLYAVPKGNEGDADQNGTRSATGDEFIEVYNPHAVPIELKGYVLSDGAPLTGPESDSAKTTKRTTKGNGATDAALPPPSKSSVKRSRLRFEFPTLTLQPGEVAVVFNGFETRPAGGVGNQAANAGRNERFGNAYVFSMGVTSKFAALANDGDCVTLIAPDGRAIQCALWGTARQSKKVDSAVLMMDAPESKGSVTLDPVSGEFVEHAAVETKDGPRFFSPGVFGDSASIAKHAGPKVGSPGESSPQAPGP